MTLATVDSNGAPAVRTVLLKFFDRDGFVFFTNLESRKALHIENNREVALLFWWPELERQVEIKGVAERISNVDAAKYFMTRPRGSQLGAWVSQQSHVLTSRKALEIKLDEMKRKFANREVPLPSFWGGFRVAPKAIEFWQGQPDRLHDRLQYIREGEGWRIQRLAP
jgi:pyridoxamine 5'-phosphate oxidase